MCSFFPPHVEYHWTLEGTNTGPGGTGHKVRISGYEEWKFGPDGLIEDSLATSTLQSTSANSPTASPADTLALLESKVCGRAVWSR